jgi:hypothetical protein
MIVKKDYLGSKIICEYNSSNLKKGEYDINTKKLDVTFNNGMVYEYDDVPHEVFSEMNIAESQGKYFNQKIAKNYNYKRI